MSENAVHYRIPLPNMAEFNPPVYQCRRAKKQFTLDGNIQKEFWADIPFTEDFSDISGEGFPVPRFKTRAKMCWDDENIYFAALLEGDEIWAHITERDAVIFYDNDFEIFIDTDSDTQEYFEFEMNALNAVWDLMLTKAYRDQGSPVTSFDIKGLQTAVHIDGELNQPGPHNKSWSIEAVFPFTSFMEITPGKERPAAGEYWRVNFSRVQWLVDVENGVYKKRTKEDGKTPLPEDNWVWAPTGVVNIHYPELWGFVFFTDSDDAKYTIPEIETRKWVLRNLYYQEHRHYDEHHVFTKDLPVNELPFEVTIETTRHTFEISCRDALDQGTISIFSDGKTLYIPD